MVFRFINRYTANIRNLPHTISRIKNKNQIPIIDYANESSRLHDLNYKVICDTIKSYPNNMFAIKCSSLGCLYLYEKEWSHKIKHIIELAIKHNSTIMIDAEQNNIQYSINRWTDYFLMEYNTDTPIVYKTYQMYRKDSYKRFKNDLETFKDISLGIKLVRGAYYNTDKKNGVLFDNKCETDASFNNAMKLFNSKNNNKHHMVVASHNEKSIDMLNEFTHENISVAHLLGFSDNLSQELVKRDIRVYKYVPFGNYRDTFPYLIRRLYENYPILLHLHK